MRRLTYPEVDSYVQQTVTMAMAKAEGWVDKKDSKWKTLPTLMLKYRSAMFLARLHYPDILMGMMTTQEAEDVHRSLGQAAGDKALDTVTGLMAAATQDEPLTNGHKDHTGEVDSTIPDEGSEEYFQSVPVDINSTFLPGVLDAMSTAKTLKDIEEIYSVCQEKITTASENYWVNGVKERAEKRIRDARTKK